MVFPYCCRIKWGLERGLERDRGWRSVVGDRKSGVKDQW